MAPPLLSPSLLAAHGRQGSRAFALAVVVLLAGEGLVRADEPVPAPPDAPADAPADKPEDKPEPPKRPHFRLEYQRLDPQSARLCPTPASVRDLANRIFGYDVIDETAGPSIALNVATAQRPAYFEVVSHLLRRNKITAATRIQLAPGISRNDCVQVLYESLFAFQQIGEKELMKLQAKTPLDTTLAAEGLPPEEKEKPKEPVKELPPPPPPPPPPLPLLPSVLVASELNAGPKDSSAKLPRGFIIVVGALVSVGLTPTPSLGGLAGLSYQHGRWSEAIEIRVDHGLVPAYLRQHPVESLYAGAMIAAPCVHEGAFLGCLVSETGGFSFSLSDQSLDLGGRFAMLGIGLRASLEHRLSETFLLRAFVQVSALPIGPYLDIGHEHEPAWSAGPGFGAVGLSFVSLP